MGSQARQPFHIDKYLLELIMAQRIIMISGFGLSWSALESGGRPERLARVSTREAILGAEGGVFLVCLCD